MPISALREQENEQMRATLWIAVSGFLLASGSAYAGTGLPHRPRRHSPPRRLGRGVSAAAGRRRQRRPGPTGRRVDGAEKLELVLKRESQNACRWDVLVTDYNVRTPVLPGHPVALTLLTHGRGQNPSQLSGGGRRRRAGRALATLSSAGRVRAGDRRPPAVRNPIDRRKFLKIAGVSLGFGALYPAWRRPRR